MSIAKISEIMRQDWDRRIQLDYRFWMSDGYKSDQEMWESGERDYKQLMQNYPVKSGQVLLEIGCGVGRLLKPAIKEFSRVIGVDVSDVAIAKATELLAAPFNLELKVNSGVGLDGINKDAADVVISFAAFGSVPTEIFARYLTESYRILKSKGEMRFQIYLGSSQNVAQDDTLYLRCYEYERAVKAFEMAGFDLQWIRELELPFEASAPELGIKAVIVSLIKSDRPSENSSAISETLLPGGEHASAGAMLGKELEYLMLLKLAKEKIASGEVEAAKIIIEEAISLNPSAEKEAMAVLSESSMVQPANKTLPDFSSDSVYESNLKVIVERFKNHNEILQALNDADLKGLELQQTEEGPVISCNLQNLDHPSKPQKAGEKWASQLSGKLKDSDHSICIVGASIGYHIEAVSKNLAGKSLNVIEPSAAILKMALQNHDCRSWLSRINSLQAGPMSAVPENTSVLEFRVQTGSLFPEICDKLKSSFYGQQGFKSLKPNIAVVGPFHGGTLPIMQYVTLSLQLLGQRVRTIDVSCFDRGYNELGGFVKDRHRRAPVENMYYEMVSQIVLESVTEKPVDILFCMALAPISPRVLNELRSRGVVTVLWFVEDYQRFTYWQQVAQHFDYVFCIQKDKCISALRAAGAKEVHYMPVACEPNVHAQLVLSKEDIAKWGAEISFMGAGYHNRQQMFASLADMNLKIWGTEWPEGKPFDRMVQNNAHRLTPAEYVKIFNATKINLNLHSSSEKDGVDPFGDFVNPRTFELASCGAFQLVDKRTLLPELFDLGKELITFENASELKDKINYYLHNEPERKEIAKRSREKVLKQHTYQHRLKDMLSIIYARNFDQLKQKQEQSPWSRLMNKAKQHDELSLRCNKAYERGEQPNLDGLISDIVTGQGKLSDTEKKLLFMYHLKKQIVRQTAEDAG